MNRKPTVESPLQGSVFFQSNGIDLTPSLSMSNSSLSMGSLTSIPEGLFSFSSSSTNILESPMNSSLFGNFNHVDGFSPPTAINSSAYRERRRQRRMIDNTGTTFLSSKSGYRMSMFSPELSPIRVIKLSFTPFIGLPTPPMRVYQRCTRATVAASAPSSTSASRKGSSPLPRRMVRASASYRGRGRIRGGIKPRRLA